MSIYRVDPWMKRTRTCKGMKWNGSHAALPFHSFISLMISLFSFSCTLALLLYIPGSHFRMKGIEVLPLTPQTPSFTHDFHFFQFQTRNLESLFPTITTRQRYQEHQKQGTNNNGMEGKYLFVCKTNNDRYFDVNIEKNISKNMYIIYHEIT